jgi:hypothetical protein
MADPITKRVPDDYGRTVLARLERSGELAVVVGIIRDHADHLDRHLRDLLARDVLTGDPKQLAHLQAAQGGLAEVRKVADAFETLARLQDPAPDAGDALGRRLIDGTTQKRTRVSL